MKYIVLSIRRISAISEKFLLWICLIILGFLFLSTTINVFTRYVLNNSIPWVQEVSSGLLIWLSFIGSSYLVKTNEHLRVDMIVDKFPLTSQKVINTIINLLIFIFLIVIGNAGFQLFESQLNVSVGVLEVSRSYYFALPIILFSIFTSIYVLESIIDGGKS